MIEGRTCTQVQHTHAHCIVSIICFNYIYTHYVVTMSDCAFLHVPGLRTCAHRLSNSSSSLQKLCLPRSSCSFLILRFKLNIEFMLGSICVKIICLSS